MTNTPAMSPLYFFYFLVANTMLHLPSCLTILISVAYYARPFALLWCADYFANRRK